MKKEIGKSTLRLWSWGLDTYHTGYRIFTIAFFPFFDCYIFHYKCLGYIPRHKDPSCGRQIYRLNVELIKAKKGGNFVCHNMIASFLGRVYFFRADTSYHYVTPIERGSRVVFSLGIKLRKSNANPA